MPMTMVPRASDPPPAAEPPSSRYTAAMAARSSREAGMLRAMRLCQAAALAMGAWAALMTWDNLQMSRNHARIAEHKPVYVLEKNPDGHQSLVLLDNTVDVAKGARVAAVGWFVRWTRAVGIDPVTTKRDRDAALARVNNRAVQEKWAAEVALAPKAAEGWTREVEVGDVVEQAFDPARKATTFLVRWKERTYRDYRLQHEAEMLGTVVTFDQAPRAGALDGVNVAAYSWGG